MTHSDLEPGKPGGTRASTRPRPRARRCGHEPRTGEWLAFGHVLQCCGIDPIDLVELALHGAVRHRMIGSRRRLALQFHHADLVAAFPAEMAEPSCD